MTAPREISRRLMETQRALDRITAAIGGVYAILAATMPDGYPGGGSNGIGHTTVADPTLGAVIRRDMEPEEMLRRRIVMLHIGATELAKDLSRLQRLAPDIAAKAWAEARCASAVCEANSVRAGLCWHHYREDLAKRKDSAA